MIRYDWDSCVFIDRIQRTPDRIAELEAITNAAEAHQVEIITSTMAIAEVCKLSGSSVGIEEQARMIREYFENIYITVYQVTGHIAEQAAKFVRESVGLKPPDAIHIATAIHAKASVLHTFDGLTPPGKLLSFSDKFGDPPMRIAIPKLTTPPNLFDGT